VHYQILSRFSLDDLDFGNGNSESDALSAKVRYVDYQAGNVLQAAYSYLGEVQQPEIISDMESLLGFGDASLDFLIANHVLEHVENPLRALNAVSRVLRRGGVAFITLPDKRFTFDKRRTITPLGHIVKDFNDRPARDVSTIEIGP
jgi:ubiquinone/menaquinone biosynthesis C-methylase UbiE